MTARHTHGGAAEPPAPIAAQSPLHDLLIGEIAAALPAPLAAQLKAIQTIDSAQDWIAAGAVYSLVADDPYIAQQLLAEMGSSPRQAALALASAHASRMQPPVRDARWHRIDRSGVFLQLMIAGLILVMRTLVLALIGHYLVPSAFALGQAAWLGALLAPVLIPLAPAAGPLALAALAGAAVWFACEAIMGGPILERARQLPARLRGLPPPLSWRANEFYAFWCLQAAALLLWVSAGCFLRLGPLVLSAGSSVLVRSGAIAAALTLIATIVAVVAFARRCLKLGTEAIGPGRH
jgi:hypothetical protein